MTEARAPTTEEKSEIEKVLNQYKQKFRDGSAFQFRTYLTKIPQEGLDSRLPFMIRGEDGLDIPRVEKKFRSGPTYVYQGTAPLRQVLEVIGYEGVTEFCQPPKSLGWLH